MSSISSKILFVPESEEILSSDSDDTQQARPSAADKVGSDETQTPGRSSSQTGGNNRKHEEDKGTAIEADKDTLQEPSDGASETAGIATTQVTAATP